MVCADLLFLQKPSKNGFIPQKDLSQHAKSQLRKMSLTERESVYICLRYGASLGGTLCFINNPTLRLLSYLSTYDE
jgi:hypothetical protein